MANYFRNIPNVQYDINGTEPNQFTTVTNIMKRVRFKPSVIENITDYYPYYVKEVNDQTLCLFKSMEQLRMRI